MYRSTRQFFPFFLSKDDSPQFLPLLDAWSGATRRWSFRWSKQKNRANRQAIEGFWLIVLPRQNATRVETGLANVPNDVPSSSRLICTSRACLPANAITRQSTSKWFHAILQPCQPIQSVLPIHIETTIIRILPNYKDNFHLCEWIKDEIEHLIFNAILYLQFKTLLNSILVLLYIDIARYTPDSVEILLFLLLIYSG